MRIWFLTMFAMYAAADTVALAESSPTYFKVPAYADYLHLTAAERLVYESALPQLESPTFLNKEWAGMVTPSFYVTPDGRAEFVAVASELERLANGYTRIEAIGRSPTGLHVYLEALSTGEAKFEQLPFSTGGKSRLATEEIAQLRNYLASVDLSPTRIIARQQRVLFYDFVFSGKSSEYIVRAIYDWSAELGVAAQVRERIGFVGLYSPEFIAKDWLTEAEHEFAKDFSRAPKKITAEEIAAAAKKISMPGTVELEKTASFVRAIPISAKFYAYAGTHGPNAQASFTPDKFVVGAQALPSRPFTPDAAKDPGMLEIYALFQSGGGERETRLLRKCSGELRRP